MARIVAIVAGAVLGLTGCITVKPVGTFDSSLQVERIPATVSLSLTTEGTATDFGRPELLAIRNGFRESLVEDLNRNGPFRVVAEGGDGTLVVNLTEFSATRSLWVCWWIYALCPVLPSDNMKLQVRLNAKLLDAQSQLLWEQTIKGEHRQLGWIYTAGKDVDFREPARHAAEQLRSELASAKATYAQAFAAPRRGTPQGTTAASTRLSPSAAAAAPRWTAAPAPNKRVAVLELRGRIEEGVLATMADRARGAALRAVRDRGMSVMTRESMAAVVKEMGGSMCADGECEVEIGRNIGADFVVTGDVIKIEGKYVVSLKLHETARGALLATADERAGTLLQLVDAVGSATDALFK